MIQPKEVQIDGKTFIISKFPAIGGREIVSQYLSSAMPKIGDYRLNEELMLKLMCYVAVPRDNGAVPLQLSTKDLVNNHVTSDFPYETCLKIEKAMMEYNCSFFRDGRISTLFQDVAQNIPAWISKTLIALSEQLSQKVKPLSTN
jgi:hypothetical protein